MYPKREKQDTGGSKLHFPALNQKVISEVKLLDLNLAALLKAARSGKQYLTKGTLTLGSSALTKSC